MQAFFSSRLIGAGASNATHAGLGPLAMPQAKTAGASGLLAKAADAGVYPPDAPQAAGSAPSMLISADLQALLGLKPARRERQVDMVALPKPVAGLTKMEHATDLLDRRLVQVRRWLNLEHTVNALRDRGLTVADVEVQLKHNTFNARRKLGAQAVLGEELLHQVPTAHYLFGSSISDADLVLLARPSPTPATVSPAPVEPVLQVRAAKSLPEPGPPVDLVRRARSLQLVSNFQENYIRALQQVYNRQLHGLWELMQGDVQFMEPKHMAAVFPCATSIETSPVKPFIVPTYPVGDLGALKLSRGFIRGNLAVVARSADERSVRISTDGVNWQKTSIYTDDVVEAEKLRMWKSVLPACHTVYRLVLENRLFLT